MLQELFFPVIDVMIRRTLVGFKVLCANFPHSLRLFVLLIDPNRKVLHHCGTLGLVRLNCYKKNSISGFSALALNKGVLFVDVDI